MKGSDSNIKSKEVLELLQISRPILTKYVKNGLIEVEVKPNGQLVSLLHCYSMKLYSKRKCDKIRKVLKEGD